MELFLIEIYEVKTNTIYNYANQLTIELCKSNVFMEIKLVISFSLG